MNEETKTPSGAGAPPSPEGTALRGDGTRWIDADRLINILRITGGLFHCEGNHILYEFCNSLIDAVDELANLGDDDEAEETETE